MCGIVGLITRRMGGFWSRDMELLEHMLVIDSLRGKDSVGVFATYRNNEVEALKLGSNVFNLFKCKEWGELKDRAVSRGRFVIGHNRAATRGRVTTENAHPFSEGNIMLVHNGTLFTHDNLSAGDKKFEVDSNAIAHALSEGEIEEVLPKLRGAYALVWYDTSKKKLFVIRNSERPLHLITTEDAFVISSEPGIAGLPMTRQNRKIDSIDEIPPHTLLEFNMKGEFTEREIKPVTAKASNNSYSPNHMYYRRTPWSDWEDDVADVQDCSPEDCGIPFDQPEEKDKSSPPPPCVLLKPNSNALKQSVERTLEADGHTQTPGKIQRNEELTQISTYASTLPVSELDKLAANNTARLQVQHKTLKKGRLVVFKPHEVSRNKTNGKYQFHGMLHELGEELVDVIGYFPEDRSLTDLEKHFVGHYCVGRVMFVTETHGGTSVYLQQVKLAEDVRVYANHRIPLLTWSQICADRTCGCCGRSIHTIDREFTAVTLRRDVLPDANHPKNNATVVCASCIEDQMKGAIKNAFIERREEKWKEQGHKGGVLRFVPPENFERDDKARDLQEAFSRTSSNSSVQDREQLRPGTGTFHGKTIELSGPKTLQ